MAEAVLAAPSRSPRPAGPNPVGPSPAAARRVSAPAGIPPAMGRVGLAPGPGEPLPADVQRTLSATFGRDLSGVRVHSDTSAADRARAMGARAFTIAHHVFLGRGERATDLTLMAHEVAHVIQQRGAALVQRATGAVTGAGAGGDRFEAEAHRASSAVRQGAAFSVQERAVAGSTQRLGISDALDYFADKANLIPGYRLLTVVLGVNPVNMSKVPRTTANLVRGVIELMPGAALITQALDSYGIFEKVGAWVDEQIAKLGVSVATIKDAISRFLDSLGWSDIFDLGGVWERAKRIFSEPVDRLIAFGRSLVDGVITFIKDAVLKPLAALASKTRGWDLLIAVLGKNPITGEKVERNAETLIGGFMRLIGQEEVWENLKKARAVERAWKWFQSTLEGLTGFVREIPGLFLSALRSLEIVDLVLPVRALAKVARVFAGFASRFVGWAVSKVLDLLQIIFEVLAPSVMPYLRKAMGAFKTIIANPIGFVRNLVRAGVQGFKQFAKNFLAHLKAALIGWLTGTLGSLNIYVPKGFELKEIIKFVLSVLGLTWANLRGKLVKAIGETAVKVLEGVFDVVITLVKDGPAAAWEKIQEQLTNLRSMVIDAVMDFVKSKVIEAAITKILSSLNPAGAFVQAVIAIYNTVMFVVERLRQIAAVVAAFVDSIAAIAAGAVGAAANKVEQTMAGLLTLVISFLARLAGLGKVSDIVLDVVKKIRAPIDKALDFVVAWIVKLGKALVAKAVAAVTGWWKASKSFTTESGEQHTVATKGDEKSGTVVIRSEEQPLKDYLDKDPVGTNPTLKSDRDKAAKLLDDITKLKAKQPEPKTDAEKKARAKEVETKVDALAGVLRTLMGKVGTMPAEGTPPAYGGRSAGGFGVSVLVAMMTKKSSEKGGSTPNQSIKGTTVWDIISRRKTGGGNRYYRLGHLLNHNIGGPGSDWNNLAPQSPSGNTTFLYNIERDVKTAASSVKHAVGYRVRVIYGSATTVSFGADKPYERFIAGYERKYVPVRYEGEAEYLWKDKVQQKPPTALPTKKEEAVNNIADNDYHLTAADKLALDKEMP